MFGSVIFVSLPVSRSGDLVEMPKQSLIRRSVIGLQVHVSGRRRTRPTSSTTMHKGASLVHVHGGSDGEEGHEAVHNHKAEGERWCPKEHQRYLDALLKSLQLGRH